MPGIVCGIFFLSGVSALLFETLWFRQAGLALGNSVWASSLVLASFMGGMALGNGLAGRFGSRSRKPVLTYACLELIIGSSGAVLVFIFPFLNSAMAPFLRPLVEEPWLLNALRLGLALALMLVPSSAMGATLPLLVKSLVQADGNFGQALGRLYGWNTLGAVGGALLAETVLIRWFGIQGTAMAAASLNVLAATGALALYFRGPAPIPAPVSETPSNSAAVGSITGAHRLLAAACLSGGIFLALEVVWFRFLLLFVFSASWTFAVLLAPLLAAIGLGGLVAARCFRFWPGTRVFLPLLPLACGLMVVLSYALFRPSLFRTSGPAIFDWAPVLLLASQLVLPVSFFSGILFTFLGDALKLAWGSDTRASGYLALANTLGAMAGALTGGLLLLPWVGIENSFLILALAYGFVALLLLPPRLHLPGRETGKVAAGVAVLFVLAMVLFPFGLMQHRFYFVSASWYIREEGSEIIAVKEGLTETNMYLRKDLLDFPYYYRLVTNGFSMAGNARDAQRYMKTFVYLPLALHRNPRDALLISYGVGSTAKTLTDTSWLRRIDIVDVSKDILEMSRLAFPGPGSCPLDDPRVKVHIEDGRFFLQTTLRKYDLITGEPPPPKAAGIVNLYTKEYFQLIYDRLLSGGYASYWLPVGQLTESDFLAISKAFFEVFDEPTLWTGSGLEWVLLGARQPQGATTESVFSRQWKDPVIGPEMKRLGLETPVQLGALFLADKGQLEEIFPDTPPLVDNFPYRLSVSMTGGRNPLSSRYHSLMSIDQCRKRFVSSGTIRRRWPASLIQPSTDYFVYQGAINFCLSRQFSPESRLSQAFLQRALTQTKLRTLVLWLCGYDFRSEEIYQEAQKRGTSVPDFWLARAAAALAARDFSQARRLLTEQQENGPHNRELLNRVAALKAVLGRLNSPEDLSGSR